MKHDPSKFIIMAGFSSLLALLCVMAFITLTQMDQTVQRMTELVKVTNAKITHANEMRDYIRLRGDTLSAMYLNDDFIEREQMRLQLAELGLNYKLAHDKFETYPMSPEAQVLFNEVSMYAVDSRQYNDEAAEAMLSIHSTNQEIVKLLRDASTSRNNMLEALTALVYMQEHNAQLALEDSANYQKRTQMIVIILTVVSLSVGVLISIYVMRETARKNFEIRYQASHDALTNLVNRKEFENRLEMALEKSRRDKRSHALCFLDLDQFKIINDTCGHKAGDELLCQLTDVINNHVRERDTLSRLGGDEFGLLLEDCSLQSAIKITEGIVRVVKKHEFRWRNRVHQVGVSIGVAQITHKTENITKVMSEADIACYAAKDMGRNQVHIHELGDEHVRRMHKELSWVADISNSIKDNRFKLYIQPINTAFGRQPEIRMYEVLLRLKDDDGNIVSPGAYIPAAERFGLMRDVDQWVIDQVVQILHGLRAVENICLFVNLSANSIGDKRFCQYILQKLKDYRIDGNSICFEITETAAIQNIEHAVGFINTLKQSKCFFALDDFGSGMASFAYLKDLPVDYLKIDGSITTDIHRNNVSHAMVAAINEVGNVMHIQTIAEHIENEMTLKRIQEVGIGFAQGYHLGLPQPIESLSLLKIKQSGFRTPTHAI